MYMKVTNKYSIMIILKSLCKQVITQFFILISWLIFTFFDTFKQPTAKRIILQLSTFNGVLFEKTKGIKFNILGCLGLVLWVCLWSLIYYSTKIIFLLWLAVPVPPRWHWDFSMCLMSQHCELWIQLWDWDIPGNICAKLPIPQSQRGVTRL